MNYFISGIGTNVGKTIVSAMLVEALQADYWKPVQSGIAEGRDSDTVKSLISNNRTRIHPEAYLLREPLSPHFAAKLDGVEIMIDHVQLPDTANTLVIEGAGGLLVPLNGKDYVIDLAAKFNVPVILVVSDYLGCINHTLLSLHYLKSKGYRLHSLVFNGDFAPEVRDAILAGAGECACIDVPSLPELSKGSISSVAQQLRAVFPLQ